MLADVCFRRWIYTVCSTEWWGLESLQLSKEKRNSQECLLLSRVTFDLSHLDHHCNESNESKCTELIAPVCQSQLAPRSSSPWYGPAAPVSWSSRSLYQPAGFLGQFLLGNTLMLDVIVLYTIKNTTYVLFDHIYIIYICLYLFISSIYLSHYFIIHAHTKFIFCSVFPLLRICIQLWSATGKTASRAPSRAIQQWLAPGDAQNEVLLWRTWCWCLKGGSPKILWRSFSASKTSWVFLVHIDITGIPYNFWAPWPSPEEARCPLPFASLRVNAAKSGELHATSPLMTHNQKSIKHIIVFYILFFYWEPAYAS